MTETRQAFFAVAMLTAVCGIGEAWSRPATPAPVVAPAPAVGNPLPAETSNIPTPNVGTSETPAPPAEPDAGDVSAITPPVRQPPAAAPQQYATYQTYQPQRRRFAILPRNRR